MKWVIMKDSDDFSQTIYGRLDDNGLICITCSAEHPEFAQWVAAGNQPEPWNN